MQKLLGVLCVAFLFFPAAASAHHCLGGHASDPGCDGGEEPPAGPPVYIFKDADGKQIGDVLDAGGGPIVKVRVPYTDSLKNEVGVALSFSQKDFLEKVLVSGRETGAKISISAVVPAKLYFMRPDCSMTPYVEIRFVNWAFSPAFVPGFSSQTEVNSLYPPVSPLYIPKEGGLIVIGGVFLSTSDGISCNGTNYVPTAPMYAVELVDPDLYTTYPYPWTLEVQ